MELGDHCGSDDLYVNDERIPCFAGGVSGSLQGE